MEQGNKRPDTMERITTPQLAQAFIEEQVKDLRAADQSHRKAARMRARQPWSAAQR